MAGDPASLAYVIASAPVGLNAVVWHRLLPVFVVHIKIAGVSAAKEIRRHAKADSVAVLFPLYCHGGFQS
jgi:hypothetical protein